MGYGVTPSATNTGSIVDRIPAASVLGGADAGGNPWIQRLQSGVRVIRGLGGSYPQRLETSKGTWTAYTAN